MTALGGLAQAVNAQIAKGVRADLAPDLIHGHPVGDQALLVADVDAEVTGEHKRRRADEHVNLLCTGDAEQVDDMLRGLTAHDRVVNDDDALAGDVRFERRQLGVQQALLFVHAGACVAPQKFIYRGVFLCNKTTLIIKKNYLKRYNR